MNVKGKLIQLAAEMARRNNMPSMYHEDWGWPKGMQITSWRKVFDSAKNADEQCRQWAIALRKVADELEHGKE